MGILIQVGLLLGLLSGPLLVAAITRPSHDLMSADVAPPRSCAPESCKLPQEILQNFWAFLRRIVGLERVQERQLVAPLGAGIRDAPTER